MTDAPSYKHRDKVLEQTQSKGLDDNKSNILVTSAKSLAPNFSLIARQRKSFFNGNILADVAGPKKGLFVSS